MVMSQGTYTFLACFAGFWLVWAVIVMLCCFCSFLQRRLKRHHEERLREQCLRTVEMEPLGCPPTGYPPPPPPPPPLSPPPPPLQLPREPPQFCAPETLSPPLPLQVPHPMPQANWVSIPDTDIFGKPPCYEEAVLMEDPPPPYSEVLADPRGGTYLKPAPLRAAPPAPPPLREHQDPAPVFTSETSKPPVRSVFPERGYSSLIRLPSSQRWDSLGHLLSNMDLNHNNLSPPGARPIQAATAMATMPRREPRIHHDGLGLRGGTQGLQGSIQGLQGGIHGLQGSIHGLQGGIQGLQGGIQGLHGGIQGLHGGIQGIHGGIQGLRGGIQGFQGGFQGLQGVHGLRELESSCGLPTAFPLLGRSTAV